MYKLIIFKVISMIILFFIIKYAKENADFCSTVYVYFHGGAFRGFMPQATKWDYIVEGKRN